MNGVRLMRKIQLLIVLSIFLVNNLFTLFVVCANESQKSINLTVFNYLTKVQIIFNR